MLPLPEWELVLLGITCLLFPHKLLRNLRSSRDVLKFNVPFSERLLGDRVPFLWKHFTRGIIWPTKSGPYLRLTFSNPYWCSLYNIVLRHEHSCVIAQYRFNDWLIDWLIDFSLFLNIGTIVLSAIISGTYHYPYSCSIHDSTIDRWPLKGNMELLSTQDETICCGANVTFECRFWADLEKLTGCQRTRTTITHPPINKAQQIFLLLHHILYYILRDLRIQCLNMKTASFIITEEHYVTQHKTRKSFWVIYSTYDFFWK